METDDIDLEDKCTYFPAVTKLEDLAGLTVALDLWNYYYSHYHTDSCDNELEKLNEIVNDNMKMPNCIAKKIIELCGTMNQQLEFFYDQDIMKLCNGHKNRKHFFLYGVVWNKSGRIDNKKTAEKVLKCPERSNDNDVVFRVIAKYCLENYLRDFPIHSLSIDFNRNLRKDHWVYRVVTDYWRIKLKFSDNADSSEYDHTSILQSQLRKVFDTLRDSYWSIREMSVYEYFWDFFDEDDQVILTKELIEYPEEERHMVLFSKMSRYQLRRLYLEEPVSIIKNYFYLKELELAKATWERVKSTIKVEEFQRLVKEILDSEMYYEDNNIQCLIDLWSSAAENLIDYVINVKNCEITEIFFSRQPKYISSSSFNFLKVILPFTTVEFRKQFFLEKGLYLILNYSHVVLSTLIENCLDVNDQVEIKETILVTAMESKPNEILERFRDVFFNRSLEEFYELLTFLTAKHDLQTRVMKRLLRSGLLNIRGLTKVDIWAKVSQFIDDLYPNKEEARRHKRKMVFSYLNSHCSYKGCFRRNGEDRFTEIDNLITQYLTLEEIAKYKENTLDHFRSVCSSTRGFFDKLIRRINIPELCLWCCSEDEEKISRFKRSFPIDKAFWLLLREILERYINKKDDHLSFTILDELLRWKFSSKKKKIKTFKRRHLHSLMRRRKVTGYWLCKYDYYPYLLKEMITWYFDNDESKIKEFEQLYKEKNRVKIVYWLDVRKMCIYCDLDYFNSDNESD